MSLNDPLANALSTILNNEKVGKNLVIVKPSSKLIRNVLQILQDNRFIGGFTEVKDNKGNILKINLLGAINGCGVIKPRFSVALETFSKFEKRFLPARNIGVMIVSTPAGLMTHTEAKKRKTGGKLIAYCY